MLNKVLGQGINYEKEVDRLLTIYLSPNQIKPKILNRLPESRLESVLLETQNYPPVFNLLPN